VELLREEKVDARDLPIEYEMSEKESKEHYNEAWARHNLANVFCSFAIGAIFALAFFGFLFQLIRYGETSSGMMVGALVIALVMIIFGINFLAGGMPGVHQHEEQAEKNEWAPMILFLICVCAMFLFAAMGLIAVVSVGRELMGGPDWFGGVTVLFCIVLSVLSALCVHGSVMWVVRYRYTFEEWNERAKRQEVKDEGVQLDKRIASAKTKKVKLQEINELLADGLITQQEYDQARKRILESD
jgi:uncharacterized membrane protein YidH (DUF202 family)